MSGTTFGGSLWGGTGGGSGPTGVTPISRLIYAALRKGGVVLAPGQTPSDDQFSDILDELNRMIGTWNCEKPRIFTTTITDPLPLDGSVSYTIGIDPSGESTADFDIARPQEIVTANILFPTDPVVRRPIRIFTDLEWSRIALQEVPGAPMFYLYNDGNYPFSTLYTWPQSPAGYYLEIYYWQAISKFTTISDVVTLPDGYEDALVCNLATRISTFPWPNKVPMDPQVRIDAARALAAIASKNSVPPPKVSSCAPSGRRGSGVIGDFNWLDGQRA